MDSATSAAMVAIGGTLLGSAVTFVFQLSSTRRQERISKLERQRSERLAVYTEVANVLTELRRAAYDRWHRHQDDPVGRDYGTALDQYYRRLGDARAVQLKLRLLTGDDELDALTGQAIEVAREIRRATTEEDCDQRGEQAKQALDAFVKAASGRLR